MVGPYLIGIDIGTAGTKTAIFDAEGNLIADSFEESKLYYPKPGWVEQDPEDFYGSTVSTIRRAIKKSKVDPGNVAAIAIGGQMAGICAIDEDWIPVTRYDSWLDTRCKPYVDYLREKHENLLLETVGAPPSIAHGPKILWWKNERPRIFHKIRKFIMPAAYVAGRLAGLDGDDAFEDHTYLHFSGFSDTKKLRWSEKICETLGVFIEKFPRIVEPWEIVGEITGKSAKECGLIRGTPICAGAGDTAASSLGAGIVEPGMVFDIAGTAAVFSTCVDKFIPDKRYKTLYSAKSVVPTLWYPQAYIGGGGLCLRWFRDELAVEEKAEASRRGINAYSLLDAKAEKVPPGSDYLMFLPHLGGRIYPYDAKARGLWVGFSWGHKKYHLYRSILEAVAYEYAYYLAIQQRLHPSIKFREVRVTGGGSRSRLWNQIKADVLGIPYVQLNRLELSVLGLAVIAGYAVNIFKDVSATVQEFVKPKGRVKPRLTYHGYYKHYVELYERMLDISKGVHDDMFDISKIRRPGES